ncbi:TPA: HAD hydrolase family protein, partial [Klebsiella pneumoniae]|nr:HAD hydrolase family protein [Klebsiella pneumoniae]
DAVFANELEIRDGKLTGNVLGDIVDAKYKANTLRKLAEKYEIPTAQTVAIGDGANDLPMIKAAGLGIAYHAKPKVNEQAEVTIRHADLMGVFCILSGSMNQK